MRTFLCVSIPTILSFFFNVKSLFILGNLIVIFLLGESKIQGLDTTFPRKIDRVEGEKTKGKQEIRLPQVEGKKIEQVVKIEDKEEETPVSGRVEEENKKGSDVDEIEDVEGEREEELVIQELSTDELNRRADDFIARVNKQIRFEADY
ncbi:hypothetical protein SOVF_203100 [Spinacia oleracea]|nr:hypothetical protein SOVF_203100 [Spinacia oleracea]